MTDIRRTLLWVVFTMSLVLLWDGWQKHNGQPSLFGGGTRTAATAASAAGRAPASAAQGLAGLPAPASVPAGATPKAAAGATAPAEAGAAPASQAELVNVTTDVYKVVLSTLGGEVHALALRRHRDTDQPDQDLQLFGPEHRYFAQSGLISLQPGQSLPNHVTPFRVLPGERELKDGQDRLSVSFESPEVNGVQLIKTYTFSRGQYTVGVTHELRNKAGTAIQPQLYLQLTRDDVVKGNTNALAGPVSFTGPALYSDAAKFKKLEFADIAKNKLDFPKTANDGWVAMVQHYFASAWIVPQAGAREFRVERVDPAGNVYRAALVQSLGDLAPGATLKHEATLFAGPQEENKLEALAPGLELVKDYGMLTVLAKPLFWLLFKLHAVIGNWGWAIVALVVLLKIGFYWLNASAYRSMAKMKAVAPRVNEMRERLKDQPQQMQQEMMRIYREEKVNPLGGCLPILVQMPFFIALYWVLLSSVEMRNAPWLGWVTDLAQPDRLFTIPWLDMPVGPLPILMTLSSLFQVWLNPTPPDPVQARMMWIMPLAFGVMFFYFPAGLVLYWLTNNLLSIAQQWFINKKLGVNGK